MTLEEMLLGALAISCTLAWLHRAFWPVLLNVVWVTAFYIEAVRVAV